MLKLGPLRSWLALTAASPLCHQRCLCCSFVWLFPVQATDTKGIMGGWDRRVVAGAVFALGRKGRATILHFATTHDSRGGL